ncbi:MAG: hypothetical protein Ta2E_12450 [Mycoplasmoidaceae bacterium]|nr:MAG: hypothetical protein Ta2E_12450 [Mycoplasmoidaceae bacterium]
MWIQYERDDGKTQQGSESFVWGLEKHPKIEETDIRKNQAVKIDGLELEDLNLLRPDIQFWSVELIDGIQIVTLNLIKISISYGRSIENKEIDALKEKRREKINKYSELFRRSENHFVTMKQREKIFKVKYNPIFVSSLVATPEQILIIIKRILQCTMNITNLWGKRLVTDALVVSFGIWINAKDGIDNMMKWKFFEWNWRG